MFTVRTVSDVLPDAPEVRRTLDDAGISCVVDVVLEDSTVSVVLNEDPRLDPMLESDVRRVVLGAIARRRAILEPATGDLLERVAVLEAQNAGLSEQLDEVLALLRARK